jgi:PKD repeat protein
MLMRGRVRTCLSLLTASAIAVGTLVVAGAAPASAAPATPQFVQVRAKEVTSGTTNSLAFSSGNTAGNLIVVYAIWSNTNSASVSDSGGNAYTAAGPRTTWGTNWSAQVFYAKNIAGGSNTVTVTFATAVNSFGTIYIHEYAGIDKASPLDVSTSAIGTSRAMSSGSVTTTNASDLLFGAGASRNAVTKAGSGWTTRSTASGNRTEDRNVTTTGSYAATATQNSNAWVMQLVAFKADPGDTTGDTTPPTVAITSPANNAQVSDIINVTADASDNVGVAGVQFLVDGVNSGPEDTAAPYALAWDTRVVANGAHTLRARARDPAGNTTLSAPVTVNVANTDHFQNEILATGFDLPTNIEFLPDGRMLVVELQGKIKVLPPPYTTPDPTPFLQLTNVGSAGVQQGIFDIVLDPVSPATTSTTSSTRRGARTVTGCRGSPRTRPTPGPSPERGRAVSGPAGRQLRASRRRLELRQRWQALLHYGRAFRRRGRPVAVEPARQDPPHQPRRHRPHRQSLLRWDRPERGLDLGARAAQPLPGLLRQAVGQAVRRRRRRERQLDLQEEVDLGAAGANYGWPNSEGPCSGQCTSPIYSYPHNGRDASITGGFVYHGTQFPSSYQGSYFFADYTQNWIRRLTFDGSGNVTGVFNFEPADGTLDGPYGDIVYLTEGPDGALYYVDLGYSDIGGTFGVSKIRRIRYVQSNQPPGAVASANPTSGPTPLDVSFSSAGSSDPEGQPLTYSWTFGDGATSTAANPTHTYTQAGQYTARLSVSDGVNSTLSTPITISAGNQPTATISSPADGSHFQAGDVISFSGDGTDTEDGSLPASAFTWNIDFLHEGHVHPGTPITGVKSGTFTIPTSGHDFSGNTRYRITLTVTDSSGLTDTKSVTIYPQKVNLTFDTVPSGLTLYLDGIAKTTPFVYDTLVGFNHTIEARNQTSGSNSYTFQSWSDGGAQQHTIVVPSTAQTYTATYSVSSTPQPIAFVQVQSATPQSPQSTVATTFTQAQSAGNLNVVVVGWNESTGNITSVTDGAGNTYQVAAATVRGTGLSQAIYYARNIVAAGAGANTVTVRFDKSVAYADVRILEYSGLDQTNPFDVSRSAAGSTAQANSGAATTNFARELIVGGGTTSGMFQRGRVRFHRTHHHQPRL